MPAFFSGGPKTVQLLVNAIDDETLSPWVDVRGYTYLTFYLQGASTTSSGVVTYEEAGPDFSVSPWPANPPVFGATTGDYTAITTVNATDVTAGKQKATHITNAGYCYVRARVSTVIGGGGSVSCGLVAT